MSGQSMADVLLAHWFRPLDYAYCRCGADMSPSESGSAYEALAAHTAAALSAAGIGPVQDAKADAWDELCAKMSADLTDTAPGYGEHMRQVNPYRKDQE